MIIGQSTGGVRGWGGQFRCAGCKPSIRKFFEPCEPIEVWAEDALEMTSEQLLELTGYPSIVDLHRSFSRQGIIATGNWIKFDSDNSDEVSRRWVARIHDARFHELGGHWARGGHWAPRDLVERITKEMLLEQEGEGGEH